MKLVTFALRRNDLEKNYPLRNNTVVATNSLWKNKTPEYLSHSLGTEKNRKPIHSFKILLFQHIVTQLIISLQINMSDIVNRKDYGDYTLSMF